MANDVLLNTTIDLNGKTLVTAEGDRSISGLLTFNRGASAPFAVGAGGASVTNLDADKVDGQHAPTGTIVGTTDVQVLTNKTLTAPTLTTPTEDTPTVTNQINLTGGQVKFPAVQVPSANANTLDDYSEGTWTPVIGGTGGVSGQTYSSQLGTYIKIGKLVIVQFTLGLTAKGTITGNVQIQGLPFTLENTGGYQPLGNVLWGSTATAFVYMVLLGSANTTTAGVFGFTGASASSTGQLGTADISNTTALIGTLMYRATA